MVESVLVADGFQLRNPKSKSVINLITVKPDGQGLMSIFLPFVGGESYVGDLPVKPGEDNNALWERILNGGL